MYILIGLASMSAKSRHVSPSDHGACPYATRNLRHQIANVCVCVPSQVGLAASNSSADAAAAHQGVITNLTIPYTLITIR